MLRGTINFEMNQIYRHYLYLCIFFFTSPCIAFTDSNLADKDFIENATQFSDENGVRIYSDQSPNYEEPYNSSQAYDIETELIEPPVVKESTTNTATLKRGLGFSFTQMAQNAKKKDNNQIKPKKVGVSFFQMAEKTKKISTPNIKLK